EIAQQRLRELEVHVRRDLRAEGRKQVVRGDALVVPVRRVAGAPGQSLAQARAREEVAVGDAVRTAGERVGDRLRLRLLRQRGADLRRPERPGLRDRGVLNLRIVALNLD